MTYGQRLFAVWVALSCAIFAIGRWSVLHPTIIDAFVNATLPWFIGIMFSVLMSGLIVLVLFGPRR